MPIRSPLVRESRLDYDRAIMDCDTKAIVDWLAAGARSAPDAEELVAQLCEHLLDCGIGVSRVGVFVLTLHPEIMGRRYLWQPGRPVDVDDAPFEAFETQDFRRSPVRRVIDTGGAVRLRLAEEGLWTDLTVVGDLRAEGATDYLATPLPFTDGSVHGATIWTSRQPGGFTDAEIAGLEAVLNPLARMIEIKMLRRLASDFLDIYVGNQGGSRILSGQIRRGHTETIHACIWLSDMRGFTALSERLPPQQLVDLINRFFDCQTPAILERGGEVLKFMGDGLLAIFPILGDHERTSRVCEAALAAAIEASATVAARFASSGDPGEDVRFGLALHLGQVMYGNIGGGNRLDFTCIGPAVNLAARIEKLCSPLKRTILASDAFAEHCRDKFAPVGDFALRGIDGRRTVFGLEAEALAEKAESEGFTAPAHAR